MRPAPLLVAALLAGCTAPPEFFEPAAFYVEGTFAYDADDDVAVAYFADEEVPPTLVVTVASAAWFDTFEEPDRCAVIFRHTSPEGLPRAAWVAETTAWFGFDVPATAEIESTCTGWDPEVWGDDPTAVVAAWQWGLGITEFDDDVRAEVEEAVIASDGQAAWDDTWAPAVFGGGYRWDGAEERFNGGFAPNGYAYGLQVDESLELVTQDGSSIALPVEEVVDGSPPTAAYTVRPWFGIAASLLEP